MVDREFFTLRHFNKAFVVYYLMSEVEFKKERFGSALRLVKRSLNCYHVLAKLGFFSATAGDGFMPVEFERFLSELYLNFGQSFE